MMKNRSSKTDEVHSGHHLYASFLQRRRRADTSSPSSLHINKYYNSSSQLTNHAFLSDNHTFKVHNYTVDSGINAYHNYDNYTNLLHNCQNLMYSNADCTCDNRIGSAQNGDGGYLSNDHFIDQDEDGFTFSSTVAGSMEFFTSAACAAHELARLSNMSPADELFVDGKIRPLMLPPLTNGPDQPTNLSTPFIDGHDQPIRFINGEDPPNFPKPIINGQDQPPNFPKSIINGHDQPNRMFNGHDQPNPSEPNINGGDQLNPIMDGQDQSKPMLDDHNASSAPAAQSVLSANDRVIKQIISANDSTVVKQEIDAKRVLETSQHDEGPEHKGDHGLSRKIDQRLKEDCDDQRVISEVINNSDMHSSLSAPASPVKDFVVDKYMNELEEGSNELESSTSQGSCYYKRCRSLSRVSECEHIKQQHLVELDDGRTKGGHLQNMRKTLQDLLKQEDKPTIMNKPKMMKNKQETPYNENIVINSYDALIKSPSLAPVPISIPQLWPVREKILATPPSTKNSNKKVRAPSPHGMHYAFQKAQAERMKKKTFLPYRPGLLGCLGYPPL